MIFKKISFFALFLFFFSWAKAQDPENCNNPTINIGNPAPPNLLPIDPDPDIIPPLYSPPPSGTKRIVYYLHGLGGNESSWSVAGAEMMRLYPNGISNFPDYSAFQNNSLPAASLVVRNNSNYRGLLGPNEGANAAFNIDPEKNYVIGSSLGGVVAREMDRQFEESGDPRRMGGLVTFGGANQGASIVNGIKDLKQMAVSGCTDLLPGPALDAIPPRWITLLGIGEKISDITDKFCVNIAGVLTSNFLSDFDKNINIDYAEGAPYFDGLNSHFSDRPKMAFYAVEDEPVFWRTMQFSGVFGVGANSFEPWGANDDQPLWNDVQAATLKYQGRYLVNYQHYQFHKGKKNNVAWGYRKKAEAWQKGWEWWLTSNDKFKAAIGLSRFELVPDPNGATCLCIPNTPGAPTIALPGSCSQNSPMPGYNCMTLASNPPILTWVTDPSDGIVKASSAKFLPNSTHAPVLMPGSSHFSMRNDRNTQECLNNLYKGGYDPYFLIEK